MSINKVSTLRKRLIKAAESEERLAHACPQETNAHREFNETAALLREAAQALDTESGVSLPPNGGE